MSSHILERERLGTLQRGYRRAWQALMLEAEGLQRASEADANSDDVRAARSRVELAAKNYRIARDELAQVLLGDINRVRVVKTQQEDALLTAACCIAV